MDINKEIIKIKYIGMDYTKIDYAKCDTVNDTKEKQDDISNLFNSDKKEKQQKQILINFLNYLNSNASRYIVNKSDGKKFDNKKPVLYEEYNDKFMFSGVVGVISDKDFVVNKRDLDIDEDGEYHFDITLQINSRLDKKNNEELSEKPYFLSTLLLDSDVKLNDDNIPNSYDELFDYLLLIWFRKYLQEASIKGFFRTYRRFERNDDRPKGVMDVTRHIKLNMGQQNGKVAYSYRENSVDNYLNHLIVEAYEYLKRKYYNFVANNFDSNYELKSLIDNLKIMIGYPQFSVGELIYKNIKPIAHPFYLEYEELRQICLKILRNEGVSVFDGNTDNETSGILFYMPDLWEQYLERRVFDAFSSDYVASQKEIVVLKGLKDEGNGLITRPDFIFYDNEGNPFMILDAKFKPGWDDNYNVLEDYTKCIRDTVDINGVATGVIYPNNKASDTKNNDASEQYIKELKISNYNSWIMFYDICIDVPYLNIDYNKWKSEFNAGIDNCRQSVKEKVETNKLYYEKVKDSLDSLNKEREAFIHNSSK
ncbi:MAG: hypothetical protein IJ763_06235 [Lachnospiraceae bacterium]|nr:hypothetical protein [Lachnospiraceae bacterium]